MSPSRLRPPPSPDGFPGNALTATVATDANGIATAPVFTANTNFGTYNVLASTPALASPAAFTLTNLQVATSIVATSGTPQSVYATATFGSPLAVVVKDILNNPMAGITVTFTPPASGASGAFVSSNTAVTDATGTATSQMFKANSTAGLYQVQAAVAELAPVLFNLTNIALPGSGPAMTVDSVKVGKDLMVPVDHHLAAAGHSGISRITVTPVDYTKVRVVGNTGRYLLWACNSP